MDIVIVFKLKKQCVLSQDLPNLPIVTYQDILSKYKFLIMPDLNYYELKSTHIQAPQKLEFICKKLYI